MRTRNAPAFAVTEFFTDRERLIVNALLTTIALWLSINFGLPANDEHPRVEFLPPTEIVALRHGSLVGRGLQAGNALGQPSPREVVSVYDNATRTIYLPKGWIGNTPAELSVLVHEMVHHLQNVGKLKFECPQEREQIAYKAQERWLNLFGRDLLRDFELDPFTLLVTTKCGY
jgi:Domain of unknown function (DUF6647)